MQSTEELRQAAKDFDASLLDAPRAEVRKGESSGSADDAAAPDSTYVRVVLMAFDVFTQCEVRESVSQVMHARARNV